MWRFWLMNRDALWFQYYELKKTMKSISPKLQFYQDTKKQMDDIIKKLGNQTEDENRASKNK